MASGIPRDGDWDIAGMGSSPDLIDAALLLGSMSEGVSLSDENGIIVYTNPAEDRMFGYEPGRLVGRHVSEQNAYPEDENQRIVADVIEQLNRTGHYEGEWRNRRRDGSEFTTASRITPVSGSTPVQRVSEMVE